jgi:hypothetical protein
VVNDIVVGNDLSQFQRTKGIHHKSFGMKDIGGLKFISGIEAAQSNKGITLCQRKYFLDFNSRMVLQTLMQQATKDD